MLRGQGRIIQPKILLPSNIFLQQLPVIAEPQSLTTVSQLEALDTGLVPRLVGVCLQIRKIVVFAGDDDIGLQRLQLFDIQFPQLGL